MGSEQTVINSEEAVITSEEAVITSEETEGERSELLAESDPEWSHQWVCAGEREPEEEEGVTMASSSLLTHVVVGGDASAEEGTSLVAHMTQDNMETSSMVAHMVAASEEEVESLKEILADLVENVADTSSLEDEEVNDVLEGDHE